MTRRIAILHYASPPVVGGVESTIAHHARGLVELGYTVRVISGDGAVFDERVETHIEPLFGSKHPSVLAVKRELDAGSVSPAFEALIAQQSDALAATLAGCEVCIAHNIHTMNKNLPLTAALARLEGLRQVAWCHDLAWANAQYLPELHPGYPWDLLRQAWANTRYVTVSETRRGELAEMIGLDPAAIDVIVPGVDLARFLRWTPATEQIVGRLRLLDADRLLLLPARLTRRKNIALALQILAEMRQQSGEDVRLIITGPPGPHNPANPGYLGELLALRQTLALESAAHFLYELETPPFVPDDDTLADLYRLADALLFPSLQEGFGIPMLEAGLSRLPVFCADIPPLRETGQGDVTYFDPVETPPAVIAASILEQLAQDRAAQFQRRVRGAYRWGAIIRDRLVPLLRA